MANTFLKATVGKNGGWVLHSLHMLRSSEPVPSSLVGVSWKSRLILSFHVRAILLVQLFILQIYCYSSPVKAGHLAREDPVEPIFTERAFIEKNLELDIGIENGDGGVDLELSPGATWVFWDRLQLGLEVPYGISFSENESTRSNISDIGLSAKVLLCCETERGYTFLSVRGDVEIPSGDRSKDIGGEGSFGFALLGGHGFTVVPSLPDLTVQVELAYAQQIRLSEDQSIFARQFGLSDTREKEIDWNFAFAQQFAGGRFSPVFEVLGTSIVDGVNEDDEGTIVELSVGSWLVPFADDHTLNHLSIGFGWRWPVTDRRRNEGQGLVIFELAFD